MCAGAAIWAKMDGIVFGAFIRDAKKYSTQKFSWRQINISCKKVADNGVPKLKVVEGFLRDECLKLFQLSQ
jgi:tRNA(Arg) A34 adenosine deaminase TadA